MTEKKDEYKLILKMNDQSILDLSFIPEGITAACRQLVNWICPAKEDKKDGGEQ